MNDTKAFAGKQTRDHNGSCFTALFLYCL